MVSESTTNLNETGWSGLLRSRMKTAVNVICKQWLYIGIAIFLATLNLLLGILTLSYIHPKKDGLLFGIVCVGILLALGHFTSLCYLIQRAKDHFSDPPPTDAAYAAGVALLFAISGLMFTATLPTRCFSGPNEYYKAIGPVFCDALTAIAVLSWLAVVMMAIASIIIFVVARRAVELAKMPPPVFPSGAEAPVMRWLNRNDPFLTSLERHQQIV